MNLDNLSQTERMQLAAANNSLGVPQHLNGTVDMDAVLYSLLVPSSEAFIIFNSHGSNALYISFDLGTTFFTVTAGNSLALDKVSVSSLAIKGSGAGTTFEILYY